MRPLRGWSLFRESWTVSAGELARVARLALREDSPRGDVTSRAVVSGRLRAGAVIRARERGVVAGLAAAVAVFRFAGVRARAASRDGRAVVDGQAVLWAEGSARAILKAERPALNLLQHLSGIATLTRAYVRRVGPACRVADTRKTLAGLRSLEKAAVVAGGGVCHRAGLSDGILIKDNHLACLDAPDPIPVAVSAARRTGRPVQVEVADLAGVRSAISAGADAVLLDNATPETVRRASKLCRGRIVLEASGGISLENVAAYARAGAEVVSVGRLTHSARALDLSLDLRVRSR